MRGHVRPLDSTVHRLAREGRVAELSALLAEVGGEAGRRGSQDRTPLHCCIEEEHDAAHVACLGALLDGGAQIDAADARGRTPLCLAAHHGFSAAVVLLLDRGAEARVHDADRFTPLHWCAAKGSVEGIDALVAHGAHLDDQMARMGVHHTTRSLLTPLHLAAEQGHAEALALLLERGANARLTDGEQRTALHTAAVNRQASAMAVLLDTGVVEVNCADMYALTPLHISLMTRHVDGLKLLLKWCAPSLASMPPLVRSGANVRVKDSLGRSPLRVAAVNGFVDALVLLLEHGADIDAADEVGRTPLLCAIAFGHRVATVVLLDRGADPMLADDNGEGAVHAAVLNEKRDIVELLVNKLPPAALNAVSSKDKRQSALHMAIERSDHATLRLLLRRADVDVRDGGGCTALLLATRERCMRTMDALLLAGADVEAVDSRNKAPLQHAACPVEAVPLFKILRTEWRPDQTRRLLEVGAGWTVVGPDAPHPPWWAEQSF